jgi:SAM-dependent methyltransferase
MRPLERFGDRAAAYAASRPHYPAAAIDAVLAGLGDPARLAIADVGAGTGISARLFAERGAHVVAIEPNAGMRAQAAAHPRVEWREGTAEATGLEAGSVDVIVACQAFHWFALPAAVVEFRRVARRRAALLQYERDERDAFTKSYGDVVRAYANDDTEQLRREALAAFAAFPGARVTRAVFGFTQRLDRSGLLGRAASSSYLPRHGPAADQLHRDLHALFEQHARGETVTLAMETYVLIADWL